MKPKLILCLAFVLSGIPFGCAAHHSASPFLSTPMQIPVAAGDWQSTLREAMTNGAWMAGSAWLGIQFYSVPEEAAKILESRPLAELLPFLAKLRASAPSWQTNVLDEWTRIVREDLPGTPYTITNSYALMDIRGELLPIFNNMFGGPSRFGPPTPPIFTNWIPVYNYTDNYSRPIRANASAEEQDILKFAEKNAIGYRGHKTPKYGDPFLVQAADKLSDIPRPWTVPNMIRLFEQEKGERSEYLARVLAASRDPRAAVALGKALDDPGYKGFGACSSLFDYFVGDDSYGLPPENRLFIWAGNALDLTIPAAHRWWVINRSQLEAEVNKIQKP